MGDDEDILGAFELHDDGFQPNDNVSVAGRGKLAGAASKITVR